MAAGDTTQGRRLPDVAAGELPDGESWAGAYWRSGGVWYCGVPEDGCGLGNLTRHTVVEHEDGTITVSPSMLVTTGHGHGWHGYLERGVWREV